MNVSSQEQKQVKLKRFLKMLSEDPNLINQEGIKKSRTLSELLMFTGYQPSNETVDMAALVSMLLKKLGLEAGTEDMMDHIINGGTVDDFMSTGGHRLYNLD